MSVKVSKKFVTNPSSHKLMQAIIVGLLAAIIFWWCAYNN